MAENGTTKGSMIAAIQSAQMAVGSALKGGAGAVSSPADMEQVSILDSVKETTKDTYKAIVGMATTLAETLAWDKEKFRREMDAAREREKELQKAAETATIPMPTKEQATGGFGPGVLGLLAALAGVAKMLNVDEILRLPQQLKSLRTMARFFRGVMRLATFGFGPAVLRGLRAFFKSFDLKALRGKIMKLFEPALKRLDNFKRGITGKGGPITRIIDSVTDFFRGIRTNITKITSFFRNNKAIGFITKAVSDAFKVITRTIRPIINTVKGLFSGAGLGILDKILGPLKVVFRSIGKIFLPITLILGVIDGVQGFMKEFGKTGSILDGIRGAVVGIVDGFIGGLVRLIGSAVEWILGFFGLDNLGKSINEKIGQLMDSFLLAVGGIVDLVMGLFSFDGERIMKGLGSMFSGVGGFFLNVLLAPLDMAANFIKDLFGFGDPEKPFSFKDMIIDSVMFVWDWVKGLFTIDFSSIKAKLFDIGKIAGAIASGAGAFVKAIPGSIVGGESPMAAFSRVYGEKMGEPTSGSTTTQNLTTDNSSGDMSTTTNNTKIMNEGGSTQGGNITIVDNSTKQNNASSQNNTTHQTLDLRTSTDNYYDREAWSFGA